MIIYNVTVKVENDIHEEWLHWMKTKHIPDVMETKCFEEYRFSKILVDEPDGQTYSIQYLTASQSKLDEYQEKFAGDLQKEHAVKYNNKFVAFRTLLKVVDQG